MSNNKPSSANEFPVEFCDRAKYALETFRSSPRGLRDFHRAAEECAEAIRQSLAEYGDALPAERLMELAYNLVYRNSLRGLKIPPYSGMQEDEEMAKFLASLSDESDLRGALRSVTEAAKGASSRKDDLMNCRFFRLCAAQAVILEKIGAYDAAIHIGNFSTLFDALPTVEPVHVSTFLLQATRALSYLKTEELPQFDMTLEKARETFSKLQQSEHGPEVSALLSATNATLTTSQTLRARSFPSALARFTRSPGSYAAFLALLKELREKHKYRQIVDACEHRAYSVMYYDGLYRGDLRSSRPFPFVPVEIFADDDDGSSGIGQGAAQRLTDDEVCRDAMDTRIFPDEMVPLYLMALQMTDQVKKGKAFLSANRVVTHRLFEQSVFASLEQRANGEWRLHRGEYDDAIKAFDASERDLCRYRTRFSSGHWYLKAILDFNIGFCKSQKNDPEAAISRLSTCLTKAQDHMEALQLRAASHLKLARTQTSLPHVKDHHFGRAISDYESFVAKYENAQARPGQYPTVSGITFPNSVGESVYQGVKDKLGRIKAERVRVAQRPAADEAGSRPGRNPPSEPRSHETPRDRRTGAAGNGAPAASLREPPTEKAIAAFTYFGLDWTVCTLRDLTAKHRDQVKSIDADRRRRVTAAEQQACDALAGKANDNRDKAKPYVELWDAYATLQLDRPCESLLDVDAARARFNEQDVNADAAVMVVKFHLASKIVGLPEDQWQTHTLERIANQRRGPVFRAAVQFCLEHPRNSPPSNERS